jgi:hypothetical protein
MGGKRGIRRWEDRLREKEAALSEKMAFTRCLKTVLVHMHKGLGLLRESSKETREK